MLVKRSLVRIGLYAPIYRTWDTLRARGWTRWRPLVPEAEFEACLRGALRWLAEVGGSKPQGDYVEFGVSRGASMAAAFGAFQAEGIRETRFVGFDSFQGLPAAARDEGWKPGDYRSAKAATERFLKRRGVDLRRVELVEGWFSDTLTEETKRRLRLDRAAVIMVDCDLYSASKEALAFAAPLIRDRAVILFDDWGWTEERGDIGQKEAFVEFCDEHPDITATELPSYLRQARVFGLRRGPADR